MKILVDLEHIKKEYLLKLAGGSSDQMLLNELAKDFDYEIRIKVASNKHTSEMLLHELSQDGLSNVRKEVAANPNTSIITLDNLSKDEDNTVVRRVVCNPSTPLNTLKQISKEGDLLSSNHAEYRIEKGEYKK